MAPTTAASNILLARKDDAAESEDDSSNTMMILAIVAIILVLLLGVAGYIVFRRIQRRLVKAKKQAAKVQEVWEKGKSVAQGSVGKS